MAATRGRAAHMKEEEVDDFVMSHVSVNMKDGDGSLQTERIERRLLIEFLEAYKSFRQLWDPSCELYFKKDARNQAYASLLKIYQRLKPLATVKEVKKKIDNMKHSYKTEWKKVEAALASGTKYEPSLWYYSRMGFLEGDGTQLPSTETYEEEEESQTNVVTEGVPDGDCEEEPLLAQHSFSRLPTYLDNSHTPPRYNGSPTPANLPSVAFDASCRSSSPMNKKMKMALWKKQERLIDAAQSLLKGSGDYCDTFGLYVAQQLQMVEQQQQAIAQKLISDALFFGKLGLLTPSASVSPSTPSSIQHPPHPPTSYANQPRDVSYSHCSQPNGSLHGDPR